jgi:tRNA pseudouridine synthase 10
MEKFFLCAECARRFFAQGPIASAEGEGCFICRGSLRALPQLLESALAQSSQFGWSTFSVASSFPRAALINEAEVATSFLPGQWTSIKNDVNAKLAEGIAKATGKINNQRSADASFEFDFGAAKAKARPMPLYIHGRYLKLSRSHCQSRWHCSECGGKGSRAAKGGKARKGGRAQGECGGAAASGAGEECESCGGSGMNYPSVEEEIGRLLAPAFCASGCTLHASGREDVDVRCLGTGRPFVAELSSPKKRTADLQALEAQSQKNESVRAVGLRMVRKDFIGSVCSSHFEKEYAAAVSAERALSEADASKLSSLSGTTLEQRTPQRVLSRRADMLRRRAIRKILAEPLPGGRLKLRILAEAGTYIKEFINSDAGRTKPSVSSLLCCQAKCDELDVVAIRDYFLETVRG